MRNVVFGQNEVIKVFYLNRNLAKNENRGLQFFYHLGKPPKIMTWERYKISTKKWSTKDNINHNGIELQSKTNIWIWRVSGWANRGMKVEF